MIFMAHADYIFMAHADSAENADFASRCALACRLRRVLAWLTQRTQRTQTLRVAAPLLPSGMYTLGETPTAVSDSDAAHSVKVCEVCVRQKNQREGNGKRAGWQAQAKRVCLCEFCALCVRQKKSVRENKNKHLIK